MQVVKSSVPGNRPHGAAPSLLVHSLSFSLRKSCVLEWESLYDELRTLPCKTEGMEAALHKTLLLPAQSLLP